MQALLSVLGIPRHGASNRAHTLLVLVVALVGLLAAAPAASAANFSWNGEGSASANTWSNGANWTGGTAPTSGGSIGTLSFPVLGRSACFAATPTEACETAVNDLTGLSVNELQVDDADQYRLSGNGFTLGAGGLSTTNHTGSGGFAVIATPVTLGASQTWNVSGSPSGGDGVSLTGALSGSSSALTVNLTEVGSFAFGGYTASTTDSEVGNVLVSSPGGGNFDFWLDGLVNVSDGHKVTVQSGNMFTSGATTGALEVMGSTTMLGFRPSESAILKTASAVFSGGGLDIPITGTGTQAGVDYSQLTSTGNVELSGVTLNVSDNFVGGCPVVPAGQTDTLVSTTGSLSGTFANAPNGSTLTTQCLSAQYTSVEGEKFRIEYHTSGSPQTVTATAIANAPINLTWSGEGSASANGWSNGTNWTGGTAPTSGGSIGTLSFPVLNRSACLQSKPSAACYTSDNDLTGLSVNTLQVDDSHDYGILGNGFSLGSGGMSINSSEGTGGWTHFNFSIINPIALSASQTWSVSGPPTATEWPAQNIAIRSALSGTGSDLTVNLNSLTELTFGINVPGAPAVDDEIGNITVNGSEATIGSSPYKYKSLVVIAPNAKLNATDGHSLTLHHVDLEGGEAIGAINAVGSYITEAGTVGAIAANESSLELSGATGPITATDSSLALSGSSIGAVSAVKSTLSQYGVVGLSSLSFDPASTLAVSISLSGSEGYGQVTSSGAVTLGGSTLALHIHEVEGCPLPHVGKVYTLVSTTGNLTGMFGNAPNGGIVYADCTPDLYQMGEELVTHYASPYRISYNTASSPATVTATALSAVPMASTVEPKSPAISGSALQGQTLTESHGSWTNSPTSYAYQWQDCDSSGNNCSNIIGATGQSYTLTSADVGHTIRVQETASNADGGSTPATSAQTAVVQAASSSSTGKTSGGGGTSSGSGSGAGTGGGISADQLKASLTRQLLPSGKGANIAALFKNGDYMLPFTALEAGTVTVRWYLVPHGAKLARTIKGRAKARKRSNTKPILVASGKLTFSGAGHGTVRLRLTAAGKRLLRHAKTLRLTTKGVFTGVGLPSVSVARSLALRR